MLHYLGRFLAPLALLAMISFSVLAEEPDQDASQLYDLKYTFQSGETLRWEVTHHAIVDTTIQGTNQTAETRSTSVKAWKVSGISKDGTITLTHLVESVDMWQKTQGRQEMQRYDSRTDKTPPAGYEEVAKAVAVPLTVITMDQRGKVLKREEKYPQPGASSTLITIPLPEQPLPVGHVWSVPLDVEVVLHGGASKKIQTRQQFTLEKVVDGLATIQVETQVITPLNDPAIEAQLIQRLTSGSVRFDIQRGRLISQQMDLDRHVVGFSGAASSMHCVTRFSEELLPEQKEVPQVSKQPEKPAPKASLKTLRR